MNFSSYSKLPRLSIGLGSAIQHLHYLPFGEEQIDQRLTNFNSRYTFSAKEKDIETGYSYFGARYYTSDLSIWLSVDPLSDKYPSMSPYNYCANNPIRITDPNGMEWEIDGVEYTPGTQCPIEVKDTETQNKWNTMNKIYSTKNGKKVIDEMDKEGVMYNVSSDKRGSGEGAYKTNGDGTGGTIYTNGNDNSIDVISHEVFHGYQDLNGQGGFNVPNEVEAYLFSAFVKHDSEGGRSMGMLSTTVQDPSVLNYSKALGVFSNFSSMSDTDFQSNFNSLTSGFKQFSNANATELYNNAPSNRPKGHTNNLIRSFFN